MRKFIISALMVFPLLAGSSEATPFPRNAQGEVVFTGVVELLDVNPQQIYSGSKLFIAKTFKSANHTIQLDDANSGQILVKGISREPYGLGSTLDFEFTLLIEIKANKFRWTIDKIYQKVPDNTNTFPIEMRLNSSGVGSFGFKNTLESLRITLARIPIELKEAIKSYIDPEKNF